MQGSIWELDYPLARLCQSNLAGTVNVETPQRGLEQLRIAGTPQAGSVGQVVFAAEPGELRCLPNATYHRGGDLIAGYEQVHGQPLRAQVYWRSVATGADPLAQAAVDLLVSLETDVPESRPCVTVETTLRVDQVQALDGREVTPPDTLCLASPQGHDTQRPRGFLLRQAAAGLSLALLVRPDDACDVTAQWDVDGHAHIVHQLVCEPLEKGVILRRRVRCVWGHDIDLPVASAWYRRLLDEKPPLTT